MLLCRRCTIQACKLALQQGEQVLQRLSILRAGCCATGRLDALGESLQVRTTAGEAERELTRAIGAELELHSALPR